MGTPASGTRRNRRVSLCRPHRRRHRDRRVRSGRMLRAGRPRRQRNRDHVEIPGRRRRLHRRRSLAARIAVHTSWAITVDCTGKNGPAVKASVDRFERQVDPDGALPPAERAGRSEHAPEFRGSAPRAIDRKASAQPAGYPDGRFCVQGAERSREGGVVSVAGLLVAGGCSLAPTRARRHRPRPADSTRGHGSDAKT